MKKKNFFIKKTMLFPWWTTKIWVYTYVAGLAKLLDRGLDLHASHLLRDAAQDAAGNSRSSERGERRFQ